MPSIFPFYHNSFRTIPSYFILIHRHKPTTLHQYTSHSALIQFLPVSHNSILIPLRLGSLSSGFVPSRLSRPPSVYVLPPPPTFHPSPPPNPSSLPGDAYPPDHRVGPPVGPVDVVAEHGHGERVLQVGVVLEHYAVVGAVVAHCLHRVQPAGGDGDGGRRVSWRRGGDESGGGGDGRWRKRRGSAFLLLCCRIYSHIVTCTNTLSTTSVYGSAFNNHSVDVITRH